MILELQMKNLIQYHTADKSLWGPGPWQDEPDKLQWTDEETGLPALIRRVEHLGHLCGYVGVTPEHPLWGINYDETPSSIDKILDGGITFVGEGDKVCPEGWKAYKEALEKLSPHAAMDPNGDAALFTKKWSNASADYESWRQKAHSEFINFIAEPALYIWWFGFSCGHPNDLKPGIQAQRGFRAFPSKAYYKDLKFVKTRIKILALQLKYLTHSTPEKDPQC